MYPSYRKSEENKRETGNVVIKPKHLHNFYTTGGQLELDKFEIVCENVKGTNNSLVHIKKLMEPDIWEVDSETYIENRNSIVIRDAKDYLKAKHGTKVFS